MGSASVCIQRPQMNDYPGADRLFLVTKIERFDRNCLAGVVHFHHIQYPVAVVSSIQRSISARGGEHLLQLKVERGSYLQPHAKVFAELVRAAQNAVWSVPAADDRIGFKHD